MNRDRLILALAVSALLSLSAGAQEGPPPSAAARRLRVQVEAPEKAASYDVSLEHHGLAQADGRDVQVTGPDGKAVSHFVSFADEGRVRILFDGSAGTGTYALAFGVVEPGLPAVPANGLVLGGRADWAPTGGYSSVTYKAAKGQNEMRSALLTGEKVLSAFAEIKTQAEAGQAALVPAKEGKEAPVPFVTRRLWPGTRAVLPTDPGETVPGPDGKPVRVGDRFVHVMTGTVDIPESGDCHFVVEHAEPGGGDLRVLFVDGDTAHTAVKGWYTPAWGGTVSTSMGSMALQAGRHTFQLYTFMTVPEIRVRFGSPNAPLEALDGRFAAFENTVRVKVGSLAAASGALGAACLELVNARLKGGEYTRVAQLCQWAATAFAGQGNLPAEFAALAQAARERSSARFWTMEGKVPERTGAAEGIVFGPPFKVETSFVPRSFHDVAGLSSAVWTEKGLVYGLPFAVFPEAWVVTSGICFDNGVLYAGLRNGRMIAADQVKEKLKWSFPGEGPCDGSPLLYRGVLYYGCLDRRLYALDAERGRMLWNFPTRGWIEGSPAAAGDTVFFGSGDGVLYAVDARLGVERWQAKLDGPILGTPVCDANRVFVGTRGGTFHALEASNGKIAWSYKAAGPILGGACIATGRVCFGDAGGMVHCLDTVSGKPVWPQPCKVGGPVESAPVFVGGVFYGGTADGAAYWGVDADEGVLGWSQPIHEGGDVHRQPLFAAGRLVFASRPCDRATPPSQGAVVVFAEADAPVQVCPRTTGPVQVDGNLNEDAWQKCPRLPAFAKANGMVVGDPVEARVMYDDVNLYVGFVCRGKDVVVGTSAHDAETPDGDAVRILLDPRQNGVAVAEFTVTAGGVQSDRLLTGVGRDTGNAAYQEELKGLQLNKTGREWEPAWKAAVTVQGTARKPGEPVTDAAAGWTVEVAIPLASLPPALVPALAPGGMCRINLLVTRPGDSAAALRSNRYLVPAAPAPAAARWMPLSFEKKK